MSTPYIYLCFYGEDRIVLWCLLKRQKSLQVCRNHILILSQFDQNHLKAYNINGTYFFRKNAIAMDQLAHEIGNFVDYVFKFIVANFLVDGRELDKRLMGYLFFFFYYVFCCQIFLLSPL
jgi:hypothetical protein